MGEEKISAEEVRRFILDAIDTVPQLEGLLLLWNSRPKQWTEQELSARLYLDEPGLRAAMLDLARRGLIQTGSGKYWYSASPMEDMVRALAAAYRTDLIRVTRLIHSKAPSAVREFARAFRFRKERE